MPKKSQYTYVRSAPAPESSILEGEGAVITFKSKKDKKKRTKRPSIRGKLLEDLRARRKSVIQKRKALNKELSSIKRDIASLTGKRRKRTITGPITKTIKGELNTYNSKVSTDYDIDLESGKVNLY